MNKVQKVRRYLDKHGDEVSMDELWHGTGLNKDEIMLAIGELKDRGYFEDGIWETKDLFERPESNLPEITVTPEFFDYYFGIYEDEDDIYIGVCSKRVFEEKKTIDTKTKWYDAIEKMLNELYICKPGIFRLPKDKNEQVKMIADNLDIDEEVVEQRMKDVITGDNFEEVGMERKKKLDVITKHEVCGMQ